MPARPLVRILTLGTLAALVAGPLHAVENRQANVVVILADDLGYGDVGVHGCRDIATPNIDRLAATGVRCSSGYAAHSFCSPMRASLMTGRYQHRFGYERNMPYDPHNNHLGLPRSEKTIATRLRAAGRATGAVGKWHLGAAKPFHPLQRGFDFFYGFRGGGHDYFSVDLLRPMGEGYFVPLERDGKPEVLTEYLTTSLSRSAIGFIDANRDKPFFLYVAYNAPHTPLQAPKEYLDAAMRSSPSPKGSKKARKAGPTKRQKYVAMVRAMDDGVGEILRSLERASLRDKTLIFFLSDNGGPEPHNASDNGPLRGTKGKVFEGGIRVPFIASWPGVLPQGTVYPHPVISHDISCTALAVAGIDVAANERLDGVSLLPYLKGEEKGPPHEALYWRQENGAAWAVRSGALKLVQAGPREKPALYDLDADIGETTDLAAPRPDDVERLTALWNRWNQGNRPPFFTSYRAYHQTMDAYYREITGQPPRATGK